MTHIHDGHMTQLAKQIIIIIQKDKSDENLLIQNGIHKVHPRPGGDEDGGRLPQQRQPPGCVGGMALRVRVPGFFSADSPMMSCTKRLRVCVEV